MDALIACTQLVLYMVVGILNIILVPLVLFAGGMLIVFLIMKDK